MSTLYIKEFNDLFKKIDEIIISKLKGEDLCYYILERYSNSIDYEKYIKINKFTDTNCDQKMLELINKNENRKLRLLTLKLEYKYIISNKRDEIIRSYFNGLTLKNALKPIAKALGIKNFSNTNKTPLINTIIKFKTYEALIIIKKYYLNLIYEYHSHNILFDYLKIEGFYIDLCCELFNKKKKVIRLFIL